MSYLLVAALTLFTSDSDVWPGFLGAGASRIQPDSLPLTWSPDSNIAWTISIPGHGQSSPVIRGERVYVTSVEGPEKETLHVLCFALADGGLLWKKSFASSAPAKNSHYISRAAPTPVADATGVFAFFESGDMVALAHDGKLLWRVSLAKQYGRFRNEFGLSASPVQTDEAVVVLIDDEGPSYLVALSKTDGSEMWKTDRESRVSWSSPAILEFDGTPQIVCSSAGSVDGYDPRSGMPLWSFKDVGGNTATTPLSAGTNRFLIAASPGRTGQNSEASKKSNAIMRVTRDGDAWEPAVEWVAPAATPSWASPIVHDGHAYWVNRVGVVYCFDQASGEQKFAERTTQSCWATPLAVGDRVYLFGKEGTTTVLASGPEFRELARNTLWNSDDVPEDNSLEGVTEESEERRRAASNYAGPTQYGIAAVTGSLLIRTGNQLYCVRLIDDE